MKSKKHPRVLTLSILTTLTVLTWVAFEVWHSFTKQPTPQVDSKTLKALDPKLDTETLTKLESKLHFPDEGARRGSLPASPSPSQAEPAPEASPTASPTPTTGLPAQTGGSE